ncbi:unnamed protein product, partial [Larinioides sclopetarius]
PTCRHSRPAVTRPLPKGSLPSAFLPGNHSSPRNGRNLRYIWRERERRFFIFFFFPRIMMSAYRSVKFSSMSFADENENNRSSAHRRVQSSDRKCQSDIEAINDLWSITVEQCTLASRKAKPKILPL